jgi:choice-of-anchor C domain-containing protein
MRMNGPVPSQSPHFILRVLRTDADRRFALLVFAILSTSLYIFRTEMMTTFLSGPLSQCITQSLHSPEEFMVNGLNFSCAWRPDLCLLLGLLVGELLVLGGACLFNWFLPLWKYRQEHLQPLQGNYEVPVIAYLEELRQTTIPSVRLLYVRNPLLLRGGPYVFGSLGRYFLAIPNEWVQWFYSDRQFFRSAMLHELSHIYNKDANRYSFAKAISYSFTVISLLPFLGFLIGSIFYLRGDLVANITFIVSSFLLSIIFLTIQMRAIYCAILRSREVYADIQAVQWDGYAKTLQYVLSTLRQEKKPLWRSLPLFNRHPSLKEREGNIENPPGVFRLKYWEAFGVGSVLGTAFPAIHDTFGMLGQLLIVSLFKVNYPISLPDLGTLLLCLFAVPIVGQLIWRAWIATRIQDQKLSRTGRFGICLAAGLILGLTASLALTSFFIYYLFNLPILLFFSLWALLLTLGLFSFCQWLALLASFWLKITDSARFFRVISSTSFLVAGLLLAFGLALFIYYFQLAVGSLFPDNVNLHTLENPLLLQIPAIYFNPLNILIFLVNFVFSFPLCFALAVLWAFPLISWFWYRKRTPIKRLHWTIDPLDSLWQREATVPRNPFYLLSSALVAAVGSLIYFGVLLLLHVWLFHLLSISTLAMYALALTFAQFGLAALFQAGIATITIIRTRPAGIVNGLLGAFLSGLVMVAATFDIFSLGGGSLGVGRIAVADARSIFLLEVNWGAICVLGTVLVLGNVLRMRSYARSQLEEVCSKQRKWRLLIFIPCLLLIIGAFVLYAFIPSIVSQPPVAISRANIVKNGDFEQPSVSSSPFIEYNAGQSFQNWHVAAGSIDLVGKSYWLPADGTQSVDLDGSDAGTIYQDLPTTPRTSYSLSFALAGNPVCPPAVKQIQVWWGSVLVTMVSFDTTVYSPSHMGWQQKSYHVLGTGESTRLRFVSLTQSACGAALDAVSVTPI